MSEFTKQVLKRLKPEVDSIVNRSSAAMVKLLDRDRDLLATDQEVAKISGAMEHQMKFHLEAIFQALETFIIARGHTRETLENRKAVIEAMAHKIQHLVAFDNVYLRSDKDFSTDYLASVEENAFKGGVSKMDRERQLELHRWLKEEIERGYGAGGAQRKKQDTASE